MAERRRPHRHGGARPGRRPGARQGIRRSGRLVRRDLGGFNDDAPRRQDAARGAAHHPRHRLRHRLPRRVGHDGREHQPAARRSRHHGPGRRAGVAADAQQLLRRDQHPLGGRFLRGGLHRVAGRPRGLRAVGGPAEHEDTHLAQQRGRHTQLGCGELDHGELQPPRPPDERPGDVRRELRQRPGAGERGRTRGGAGDRRREPGG